MTSRKENRFIVVITDRYSKLTRAKTRARVTVPIVTAVFLEPWTVPNGILNTILADNGPQFLSTFFAALCVSVVIKLVTITGYHPESRAQVERFNKTLVARWKQYIARHQSDWDLFVQPITYGYNIQVHRTTRASLLSLSFSREPPEALTSEVATAEEFSRLSLA